MFRSSALLVAVTLVGCADANRFRVSQGHLKADSAAQSKTMSAVAPYYHTTDDIHQQLTELATRCPGMSLRTETNSADSSTVSIDVVNIKGNGQAVNKNFLLFGEHARELISPESGLHLVKALCGEDPELSDKARETLKDSEFEIVVNGNPKSRSKVEQGDFCLRINENGVDLNRNWDEKWESSPEFSPADTNPGTAPFSEPETQIFKKIVSDYNPTNFLTIHSGTRGMYMPWAFDMHHLAQRNQPEMMKILEDLDKNHCECPFGAAGKEVGYPCPGTCLDWVYDQLQTPYSFAFEIYIGPEYDDGLSERFHEKMQAMNASLIQKHSTLAHEHFNDVFGKHPSDFIQLRSNTKHERRLFEQDPMDCFGRFNPDTEDRYNKVVSNWADAYLDLAQMVATNLKKGIGSPIASETSSSSNVTSFAFMG